MSADVAQPAPRSPPRMADQRSNSSNSSFPRLSEHDADNNNHRSSSSSSIKKRPPAATSSHLRNRSRRRSDECTDTGSTGYGSSAPLESEASYSSHLGYPLLQQHSHHRHHPNKSPTQLPEIRHRRCYQINSPGSTSSHSSSTSTPSSGAYLDVSSSARKPRNALVRSRTGAAQTNAQAAPVPQQPTTTTAVSTWNNNNNNKSGSAETGYVVDSEKGNAYFKGQLLGKGGFARVYLITDIATRKQYACKIIPKHHMQKIHMQKVAREIMIHKELNHVNVVKMHHYFEDTLNVYMLLEACPKKSLVHVLKYRGKVTEPEARYYMKQMANGVAYIHSQMIIHRDLKPGNMFLSDRMIVKIGDFGLATQPDNQRVTICGTPNFIAPEVLFKQSYSYEADVWALGCILYVLLLGQPPFDSSTLKETYSRICNHRYKELDDTTASRAGQDLVKWLLQPKPELRPTLDLVNKHPYLTHEYAPASLPESCCYQAPRLPLVDASSAASSFSSSLNFAAPGGQPAEPQKPQDAAKRSKSGKKKVSSWLASWRLPMIPRFRQRISSVLCLEARKKQQALSSCAAEASSNASVAQSQLMARALEDCLAGMPKSGRLNRRNPPTVHDYSPLFVTKWIDYSNKYGLAFQLYDKSVGVLFNDSSKMSYTQDRRRVEYITADGEVTRYSNEQTVPKDLHEKLELLRHFTGYMDEKLTDGGEISKRRTEPSSDQTNSRASKGPSVPLMRRWMRTSKAIVMELSVPLLQMNFIEDHTKLIVSQASTGAAAYLLTYIDGERRASTYWLNDLRDYGCSAELHERMLYIYKVAKEFAELDAAQAF